MLIERKEVAGPDDYPSDPPFQYRSVPSLITGAEFRYGTYDKNLFRYGSIRATVKRQCHSRSFTSTKKTGLKRHSSRAPRVPLPQKLRLTLLLSHPTGQNKQRVAEAIQKTHESRIQRLFSPQSHTETFGPSTDRSGLV